MAIAELAKASKSVQNIKNTSRSVAGPLARKLAAKLTEEFSLSKWEIGAQIPTEHDICQQHDLSRTTVRSALAELENAGTISRIRGKGTFLTKRPEKEATDCGKALNEVLFLVPMDRENRHISLFNMGFHDACEKEGYASFICSLGSTAETERQRLMELDPNKYVGTCILPRSGVANLDCYFELARKGSKFVLLDLLAGVRADSVIHDCRQATYLAVKHLVELGHKKIGVMKGLGGYSSDERDMGYIEGLGDAGIAYNRQYVWSPSKESVTLRGGYNAAIDLIGLSSPPTALIAESDEAAVGMICALKENGYNVPQDMAVVGSGGLYQPGEAIMPLTTIEMSMTAQAQEAVRLLKWRIENPHEPQQHIKLPVELVVRQSTVGESITHKDAFRPRHAIIEVPQKKQS